jgi:hypothetical protein
MDRDNNMIDQIICGDCLDVMPDISKISEMIYNTYHNVYKIKWRKIMDSEVQECEKFHCKIHLKSKPAQILEDEDVFYDKFFNNISEDKQDLFVITYKVS